MQAGQSALHLSAKDPPQGGASVLQIKDAFLNYASSEELKDDLKNLCRERMARGVREFVVDLSTVKVMDSCGLSVLIGVKKLVEPEGGRLCLIGLSPMICHLFTITKLDRVFEIHEDERTAVDAFGKPAEA